jgi:hypothetical protein
MMGARITLNAKAAKVAKLVQVWTSYFEITAINREPAYT